MIKKSGLIALFSIIFLFTGSGYGQIRESSFSFGAEPLVSTRFNTYKGAFSEAYKDSIEKADKFKVGIGASFLFGFRSTVKRRFYTGLQFQDLGFTRRKENLKFKDTIHPDIGIMLDLSQTGPAYADFHYKYYYLSLPILISEHLKFKKLKNTRIEFMYGLSFSVLLQHHVQAKLRGFSVRGGQKIFKLANENEQASGMNVNLLTGFRFEGLLYGKETFAFIQPGLILPLLPANNASERHHLLAASVMVGIAYRPDPDKRKP